MKSLVLLHPDWMQIITDCFWLSAHLSNQITKKVSCFLIQSEFSHPHSTWWWYWLYWQRFVYWLISAEMNSLLMIIDEVYWCWLLYCPCILLMSVCEADSDSVGQYWLISSVTTEIYWSCPWPSFWQQQFLPLPWRVKKREAMFCILFHFIISVWREDFLCVFQRRSWRRWRLRPQRRGRCPRRRRVGLVCVREASFYREKQIRVKLFMKHKLRVYTDDKMKPNWGHTNGTWPSHKPQSEQQHHCLWSFQTGLNLS